MSAGGPWDNGASAYAGPPPFNPSDWTHAPLQPAPVYTVQPFIGDRTYQRRGRAGQWREEWAAVVRWAKAMAGVNESLKDAVGMMKAPRRPKR
jgi:hypothetical protein